MFCLITNAKKDGLGKIVHIEGMHATVEYFDSPGQGGGQHRVEVALNEIERTRLGINTRVYVHDEMTNQWFIGRVRKDYGDGILVRLPNQVDVKLNYEQVFVRWKHPIKDPTIYLGNFITETPRYAEARSGFLKNYLYQRECACGISTLLSSSIELEKHQINVVQRVLTDHSQRYLLADEVGLGKTIEAGVVVRQAVLDDLRGHRILILVPHTLVEQWREELTVRFGLRDFVDISVFVLPQENSDALRDILANEELSLLVIDEAHNIADPLAVETTQELYRLICTIAHRTNGLLLLSATPILGNEYGFLRMLHLLDPVVYPLDDRETFLIKVANRQALAEIVAALDPGNVFFMEASLNELIQRVPNDPRLVQLSQAVRNHLYRLPDENDLEFCTAVRQLRAHISETYRLNRRILRNRRREVNGLTPNRQGVEVWTVQNSPMGYLEQILEDWRVNATLAVDGGDNPATRTRQEFYWQIVHAFLEGISTIRQNAHAFNSEPELLDTLLNVINEEDWLMARLQRLGEGLNALPNNTRAVIFCNNRDTADSVFNYLNEEVEMRVVRHDVDEFDNAPWREFLTNSAIKAIVCDRRAEEGINLQGQDEKVMVHFDLPLQPNRIEQRLGRLDRYGGQSVKSYVLLDDGSFLQRAWFDILDQGWNVFKQSISSLQYLVEAELKDLAGVLFHEGSEALDALRWRLSGANGQPGLVASELKRIDHQDALDQLSVPIDIELDENLFEVDGQWRESKAAMMYWIKDTLMFDTVNYPLNPAPIIDQAFRLRYITPDDNHGGPRTLIPLSTFIHDFLGVIDFEAPGNNATRPLSYPYVAHRMTGVKRGIRLFRYGSEFIEAVKAFSDRDDRGRSYAMWRQLLGNFPLRDTFQPEEIKLYFRFDFLIETRLDEALSVLVGEHQQSNTSAQSILSRRGDALFGPTVMQVWINEDGTELAEDFVSTCLLPKYVKRPDPNNTYIDKNLESPELSAFQQWQPDIFENWNLRCKRMRDAALAIVLARAELQEKIERALTKAEAEEQIRYAQLQTRIQSLQGVEQQVEEQQFLLEQAINQALHRGISSPSIKVDVAGVVFLTRQSVERLDPYLAG